MKDAESGNINAWTLWVTVKIQHIGGDKKNNEWLT